MQMTTVAWCIVPSFRTTPLAMPPSTTMCPTVASVCSVDAWLRAHPPRFTWKLGHIYFPALDLPLDHPAVSTLSDCLRRVGLDPTPQGFGAATDLAWYGERNLPGIICGPGRLAQCHVANEYLELEQLLLAAQVYAEMLVDWCG